MQRQRTAVNRKRGSLQPNAKHRRLLSSKPCVVGRPKGIQVEINGARRKTGTLKSAHSERSDLGAGKIVNGQLSSTFNATQRTRATTNLKQKHLYPELMLLSATESAQNELDADGAPTLI